MTHTQNTPPDNATTSKVADFWELRPQRVELVWLYSIAPLGGAA
ncbi:hypothetical protein [Rhodococcus sp. IEGM 1318]|nr:hypothetical protein [Rhodococcus sp. IEGM 1318]MDV8005011.1 hypothetical protein [Rhodococcus sp. IEGM 1318]